jgi:hypothetical protein
VERDYRSPMGGNFLREDAGSVTETLMLVEVAVGGGALSSSTRVHSWVVLGRLEIITQREGIIPQGP